MQLQFNDEGSVPVAGTLRWEPCYQDQTWDQTWFPIEGSTSCPCTPPTFGPVTRTSCLRRSCYREPSQTCRSKSVQDVCDPPPQLTTLHESVRSRFLIPTDDATANWSSVQEVYLVRVQSGTTRSDQGCHTAQPNVW